MPCLTVLGLGYVGEALAHTLKAKGWTIQGTTRCSERAEKLKQLGIQVWTNLENPDFYEALSQSTHLLISIPPVGALETEKEPKKSCCFLKEQPFFHALSVCSSRKYSSPLSWLGYLSSTSVYGDHEGAWLDEETVPHPNTPEGIHRLCIENELQRYIAPFPIHIFRLAGIYGPGRNALVSILTGTAQRILKKGVVFSRIHLEDILQVLQASMIKDVGKHAQFLSNIYNVADDEPSSTADVVAYACNLLNKPTPPILAPEEATLSKTGKAFYQSSKKILNQKIKRELDFHPTFPNYREGLKALISSIY